MSKRPPQGNGLGDSIASALSLVGITEERLSGWLGRPCGCRGRKEKLNRLGEWALRVLSGTPPPEATSELATLAEDPSLVQAVPVPTEQSPEPPVDA